MGFALIDAALLVPESLSCRYSLVHGQQAGESIVLVAAFRGVYPEGARGHAHGRCIATQALQGVHAFDADALVLDFRHLNYRRGIAMLRVFEDVAQFKDGDAGRPRYPVVAVVSELCGPAMRTLVQPEVLFDGLEPAIAHCLQRVEAAAGF